MCFRRSEKKLKCNKSLQKLCRSPTPHIPNIPTHTIKCGEGHDYRDKSVRGIRISLGHFTVIFDPKDRSLQNGREGKPLREGR